MTDFRQDKAIYRQMSDRLCDDILSGRYNAGDRIPSVRELSEMLEVNTNTVVRAYDQLTRQGIVFTRRGMGYFVWATSYRKTPATSSWKTNGRNSWKKSCRTFSARWNFSESR